MQEFINIRQGSMSVKEYSLKFTQLSKHAPTMVADSRAKMNKCFIGIFYLVVNECRSDMFISGMDISCFMVHSEQIKEQNLKQVCKNCMKLRTENGICSKTKFEVQDKQRLKGGFPRKAFMILQG